MKFFRFSTVAAGLLMAFVLAGCKNSKSRETSQTINSSQEQTAAVQGKAKTGQGQTTTTPVKNGVPTVTLTEYADFQCPTCKYFSSIVNKLEEHYGDTLIVHFRYFPLRQHRYSRLAARAAQAAKNQGKFHAMHDILFKNQAKWADSRNAQKIFVGYAQQLGLDMAQFKSDLNSAQTEKIVMEQKKEGQKRGIHATPTFFINDEMVTTLPQGYEAFKALLDIYVNEAQEASNS